MIHMIAHSLVSVTQPVLVMATVVLITQHTVVEVVSDCKVELKTRKTLGYLLKTDQ